VDVASARYYVIRKGQEWKETKRTQQSSFGFFNCVLDCPFGAEQSQGTRRHTKTRCHEGQSSPGGDKTITALMTSNPTGGCAW
jgi:hypothetical protein